jgi:hypothetical protein
MTRVAFFVMLTAGLVSASASRADVDIAPAPREIRPDGTRDTAPAPAVAKKENPLEVVDRIIKNSKAVGDKLAMTDTGPDTQQKQDTILKDIQSLIDQQENPPPPKPDQNQDKDKQDQKDKDKKPDDKNNKKDDMMPMAGMNDMSPKKDMPMGGMGMDQQPQQPMGDGDQPKERRPRQQNGEQPKDPGTNPGAGGQKNQQPAGGQPKDPGGKMPDPLNTGKPPPGAPSLLFEDEIVKDVWGNLPAKLRQQATEYYRQEFMPRYAELLKHYYSSLSEKGGKR